MSKGYCGTCGDGHDDVNCPDRPRHNHITRDIKPKGMCPECDEHWARDARFHAMADVINPRAGHYEPASRCGALFWWSASFPFQCDQVAGHDGVHRNSDGDTLTWPRSTLCPRCGAPPHDDYDCEAP